MSKWEKGDVPFTLKCPFCGYQFYSRLYNLAGTKIIEDLPECKNCGADMRGDDEK